MRKKDSTGKFASSWRSGVNTTSERGQIRFKRCAKFSLNTSHVYDSSKTIIVISHKVPGRTIGHPGVGVFLNHMLASLDRRNQ